MLYLIKSVIFLYRSSRTQHLNAYPGSMVQHHCKALKEGGMVYVLLPPTHSGIPFEMPPTYWA
jgi:hypothetical protein